MKKILLFVSMIVLLATCNSNSDSTNDESTQVDNLTEMTKFLTPIIDEYPNYVENKIANDSVSIRIIRHIKSCVGQEFTLIHDTPLDFLQVGTVKGDSAEVWFMPFFEIGRRDDNLHPNFLVCVTMPSEKASKMSHGIYCVTGKLKEWDLSGRYRGRGLTISDVFDFGNFIMTDAKVKIYE